MKKFLACSLIAMLACGALLAGCGGDKKDEAAAGKTKAAFVYVSSAKDGGSPKTAAIPWRMSSAASTLPKTCPM